MEIQQRIWKCCIAAALACVPAARSAAALLPFPLSANQRGTVACVERAAITYDIYLPPGYSTTGAPLPILYTMHPNGGGMVGNFQAVCASMNIIVVGITGSANGIPWDTIFKEYYAVTRDIRQRVLFDPTAEFAGGFSGGGEGSYFFSRFHGQHTAGLIPMAGWLGRQFGYYSTDRVQTNLLVARITGNSDTGAIYFLEPDSNYLATCGAVIRDWDFSGGHTIASPDSVKSNALAWLLSQRIPAGPTDQTNSVLQANSWRSRIITGQRTAVVRECVAAVMEHPRSWLALQAQIILDEQLLITGTFRSLVLDDMAQGDQAYDFLYYYARGAANAGDVGRYRSAMKALTGVTGAGGDRAGDIRSLLLQYKFAIPIFQYARDPGSGVINFSVRKDTPGLDYVLLTRTNVASGSWQDGSFPAVQSDAVWSAGIDPLAGPERNFFRLLATPSPGSSPPWPE